jgi:ankyrin repeat protein
MSRINNGRAVLMNAANHGLEVIIELLLKQGVDLNVKEGGMPLMDAAANGHVAAVDLFLASDKSTRTSRRTTVGHRCRGWRTGTVAKLLVERDDVEADSKDWYGWTPLSRAAAYRHEAVVKALLVRDNVGLEFKGNYGRKPLL